jgi:hypothetical protein
MVITEPDVSMGRHMHQMPGRRRKRLQSLRALRRQLKSNIRVIAVRPHRERHAPIRHRASWIDYRRVPKLACCLVMVEGVNQVKP